MTVFFGFLLALSACNPQVLLSYESVALRLALPHGPVLDPKLAGEPALSIHVAMTAAPAGQTCLADLTAVHSAGQQRTWTLPSPLATDEVAETSWNGLDDAGLPFDPGAVQLAVTATCDGGAKTTVTEALYVVRLHVVQVDFHEGVPLAYHKLNLVEAGITLLDDTLPEYWAGGDPARDLAEADENDGSARLSPAPWTDPDAPPFYGDHPNYSLPAAYVAGTSPLLTVTAGSNAVSPRTGTAVPATGQTLSAADLPPLRWAPEDLMALDVCAWMPGGECSLAGTALSDTLGYGVLDLTWRWQVEHEGQWLTVPGYQQTQHPLYRLAGVPTLAAGEDLGFAPGVTWIGVLDDLAATMEGLKPDTTTVLSTIREALHYDDYLIYNPSDSAYTDYSGPYVYWDYIWLDLSGWLDRQDGIELYCHSVSCLLSTLSGMWGVDAPQQVLGVGFSTNLTRAAGTEQWQRWSFTSHSVVSPDGGATVWDASIDLDGDDDPWSEPVEPVTPAGMPQDEYLWRLTYDDIDIVNSGNCYFH